jgi:hypothetical protein
LQYAFAVAIKLTSPLAFDVLYRSADNAFGCKEWNEIRAQAVVRFFNTNQQQQQLENITERIS